MSEHRRLNVDVVSVGERLLVRARSDPSVKAVDQQEISECSYPADPVAKLRQGKRLHASEFSECLLGAICRMGGRAP